MVYVILLFSLVLAPSLLLADGAPSPYDQNSSGPFVAPTLSFGQSRMVGDGDPGTSVLGGVEAGFIMAQQSWNRMELSLEAATGTATFQSQEKVDIDLKIGVSLLAKFGYGYSIGHNSFGVIRLGVGPISAEHQVGNISENVSGITSLIGYDLVFKTHEQGELVGGIEMRFTNLSGGDVDSYQLNTPGIKLGYRILL